MRMFVLLVSLLLSWPILAVADAERDLVGHWKLQNDCRDYSGRGNNGVNHGARLTGGAGAEFDGAGACIAVPDSRTLDFGSGDFTITAWVRCRPGAADAAGDIVSKFDAAARKGLNLSVADTGTGYGSRSDVRLLQFGIDSAVEGRWEDCGRPLATNPLISGLIVYRGELYAATTDAADFKDACRIFRYAGGQKWVDCGRVSPDVNTRSVYSMIVHQGALYVGTGTWDWEQSPASGPNHVYRYDGGTSWHDCGQFGRGKRVMSLASVGRKLFAVDDAGDSWRYDGDGIWAFCGSVPSFKMISTALYRGRLYAGADNNIYRYDGASAWEPVGKFPYEDINQVHTLTTYEGNLYAGTWPLGRVLRYDGDNNWTPCGDLGISTAERRINEINDFATYNGKLYAGVIPLGEVWRYEGGSRWTMLKQLVHVPDYAPAAIPTWSRVPAMAVYKGRLYAGTGTCHARAAIADFAAEVGKVFSYEAGKSVSYDEDLGTGWRHIAAVRSKDRLKLYVDGRPVATATESGGAGFAISNGKPLLIGFGSQNYFSGSIRDVRAYKRALSAADVQSLHTRTRTVVVDEPSIHIVVNRGRFDSVEDAAVGEASVNFWDDDLTDDDAATESFAAAELSRFLSRCPGMEEKTIAYGDVKKLPARGYVFVLGSRASNPLVASLDPAGAPAPKMSAPESYRIRAVTSGERTVCIIEGASRVGTLYGVYDYLQRIGFRFFGMGEKGTVYPAAPFDLIRDLQVDESPAFRTRGFHAWQDRGNDDFFLWMARNRLTLWTSAEKEVPLLKKLGMQLAIGSHDIQTNFLNPRAEYPYNCPAFREDSARPADPYQRSAEYQGDANADGKLSYFEAHPEWFGLQGGKRSDRVQGLRGDNFCTSNRDAVSELARNYVRGLIDGIWSTADVVNFWMEDGGRWCECENCKRLGSLTDRLLLLVYDVNKAVQRAREAGLLKRSVHLTTLAYSETIASPTRALPADFDYENCSVTYYPISRCYVHDLADPSCTEFNKRYYENLSGWTTGENRFYKGAMFIGEYYNVSLYWAVPALYTRSMSVDIPMYFRTGARHFHYMHTPTRIWGTWTLNQYLMARLLWNPSVDASAVLDDYFSRYYPTTATLAREFYRHLEDAYRNVTCLKAAAPIGAYEHLHYETYHPELNDGPDLLEVMESLASARKALDAALLACSDPVEKLRLIEDERRFAYGEAIVSFRYHVARIDMFEKRHDYGLASNEFGSLEREARFLKGFGREMVESYLVEGEADGLVATRAVPRYRELEERYGTAAR